MADRRPLVVVDGRLQEICPNDKIPLDVLPAGFSGSTLEFTTPLPALIDMQDDVLYFDKDCKTFGWKNSAGQLCEAYIGEGDKIIYEDLCGFVLAEDGSGFMRD